ncbi:MAG: GNAT family N-acetyltransferase [Chloroflexota bacterium]
MTDMLVKLYNLPPLEPALTQQAMQNITVRRALAPEAHLIAVWVEEHFRAYWVSECMVAVTRQPVSCFVATQDGALVGFSCYDTTRRGFFGPTGVAEAARGRGIGKSLLLVALHDMWAVGYGYAVIGSAGPVEYYERTVGATAIPESIPGVYAGMLRNPE